MSHRIRARLLRSGMQGMAMLALMAAAAVTAATGQEAAATGQAPEEAYGFVTAAEKELLAAWTLASRGQWIQATYINHDSQELSAYLTNAATELSTRYAREASRFDDVEVDAELRRKLELLKRGLTVPAPSDPELSAELTRLQVGLEGTYGSFKHCPQGESRIAEAGQCLQEPELTNVMAESRDPAALEEAWSAWHALAVPMRDDYTRTIELGNLGARELGYADVGALWRSKYDMDPDAFAAELERLWGQVKPLYDSLHCFVRAKLNERYGDQVVPLDQPIPAHLLGNMWAQSWSNIYPLVAPQDAGSSVDVTALLKARDDDPKKMVETGEAFFTSLGLEPLPETFWERSMLTKPRDREVVCHASAWDVDQVNDLRIKMCIEIDAEDFQTIHHELGHNFYQRAYNHLPPVFRDSANDGFHEALGDTVALSVTPEYLERIGLLDQVPDASADLGLLLERALDKVSFLPFGLLIDQWRWKVYSGDITPEEYTDAWWELREKYQGVRPPAARPEDAFDPGAKYHVPASVPYTRYFLAHILQFQFHRALCETAGFEGPLHRCSIYGNAAAGQRLRAMMEMGLSRPWQDALEALTGQRQMDATAILDYFAPLKSWLDEQNAGRQCGW
ncbi:MAG: M2 family metallopeptidase [Thermoanaerobaculia bacterium]